MFTLIRNFFFPQHEWIHIAFTFSKDHRAAIYIDGVRMTGKNKTVEMWSFMSKTESKKLKKHLRGGDK